ncbi:piggyBac transposable element-derived protein 1-like [Ixodes scapularis]|uniref:piggyBac transposable element-derived protein 1-like n=1 Tax=Ixodes scapularis TaxID=6945 RepID=UPI001A9E46AD|nr:piggyBac transposable element-derived protein 1-like [Ixodes scapularis]
MTVEKLTSVLGMFFRMGLVDMHNVRAYWEHGSRYELVAQIMSRSRFEKIAGHLHFADSDGATDEVKYDKCWKLRPWLSELQENMLKIPQECKSSVDEILIPFRGRSPIRQYLPHKPKCKWGLKLWARACDSGLCYDFDVYQACSKGVYEDQEGYQLGLVCELTRRGVSYIGSVRENRLQSCKLMDQKGMKMQGRGACDSRVASCGDKSMIAVKWFDNRAVTLLSNCTGVEPVTSVKMYDKKEKSHISVECPAIVPEYHKLMDGVDLLDKVCYSYMFSIRSKRGYMYIFWHSVKIAAVNAWFLHKCHSLQHREGSMPLRDFLADLATSLVLYRKRPPGRPSQENLPVVKRASPEVPRDVRGDGSHHWLIWMNRRNRCKLCTGGYSYVACSKCNVLLCINKDRNCFVGFHRS